MEQINGDFHLISELFIKEILRQPPLDVDYWWKQKRSTPLNGMIIVTIEELKDVWDKALVNGSMFHGGSITFQDYIQSKGIKL